MIKKEYFIEILIWFLLVIFLGVIGFSAYQIFFAQKNTHILYFRDVDGIVKGSPVKFLGVIIGHVQEIIYKGETISVQILITKKGIEIPNGSRAKVQFTGIAGSKSIEIEPPNNAKAQYVPIITENPMRVKDIFEHSRSYTRTMISIENETRMLPMQNVYQILDKLGRPYDWSSVDKMLDETSSKLNEENGRLQNFSRKEKNIAKQIDKINDIIKK